MRRIQFRAVKSVLQFLFPEVQLFQLVKEKGFFNKERKMTKAVSSRGYLKNEQPLYSTPYSNRPQTSSTGYNNPKSAQGNGTPNGPAKRLSIGQLDRIFQNIQVETNSSIVGQEPFIADLVAAYKLGYITDRKNMARNVILMAGKPGTGKKTALQIIVNELHAYKLAKTKKVVDIDLSRYEEDEISGNFIRDMSSAFQDQEGTVLFRGIQEANSSLIGLISQLTGEGSFRNKEGVRIRAINHFIVFYIEHSSVEREENGHIPASLREQLPVPILKSIQSVAISQAIDHQTMGRIANHLLIQAVTELSNQTQTKIAVHSSISEALAKQAVINRTFGEAVHDWINKHLIVVFSDLRARNEIRRKDQVRIHFENDTYYIETPQLKVPIQSQSFVAQETIDDVLKELNALIGLETVKTFVRELMETVQMNQLRSLEGKKTVAMALHMVFTGNPGTGKTTVARLIARILKAMGLLSQGQLVEVARQDLVGQYVGSTAPKTMTKVNEALGGVLFIDEAYTLARNNHDSFGLEAIDTIVKAMEDHRDDLVVVIAGYTQETETFLRSNPGLRSRFPLIVEFPDYTPADMLEIMLSIARANGFQIDEAAHKGLIELFEQRQIPGRNDSGNGRLVRNLFEEAVRKQAIRVSKQSSEADLQLLVGEDFGIGEKEAFNIENELAGIVGLEKVKDFIRALEKQLIVDQRRKEAGIQVDTGQTINMIFSGNPGTGKTTMARLLAGMLRSMGFLKKGHLVEVDRSDLIAEYVGQTANKTKIVVESALGGVLFIDEAYSLAQDGGGGFGKEAIDTLVRLIELHKDNLVVIMAGYTEDMERFVRINPGMASRFPLQIEFPDYKPEELEQIASIMINARGFKLHPEVSPLLRAYFDKKQVPGRKDSGNGRLVRNTLEEAIRRQAERLADDPDLEPNQFNELVAADFGLSSEEAAVPGNALQALDSVVGLDTVKNFVRSLSAQIEVAKRRREHGLQAAATPTLHMIFKGNPGTGKTTIARILSSRLKELGAIKTDTFVETDRSGLVAGYVGQTAIKTKEVIESALGGILFVDEAYALAEGDQFGREAINTLVKAMDDYRDRLVVILAGYDEDMERFLNQNAGLRSRFPNIILFPDYSLDELLQISNMMFETHGYVMDSRAEQQLRSILEKDIGNISAGNGRLVRNLVEKAIRIHALRLSANPNATVEELSTITAEDFLE